MPSPSKPPILESPAKRVDLSEVQINLDGFDNFNIEEATKTTAYIDEQENITITPPLSPKRTTTASKSKQKESTWLGVIEYKYKDFDIQFPCSCYPINGVSVEEYVPRVLKITNRMSRDALLTYLPKIDYSATRNRTCVYFDVEEQYQSDYKLLFDHLRQINRGGVISLEQGTRTYGMSSAFFKEIYIFPLAASDRVPPFIRDDEYDRDLKDTLIGVFLTDKDADAYAGQDDDAVAPKASSSSSKRTAHSSVQEQAVPNDPAFSPGKSFHFPLNF